MSDSDLERQKKILQASQKLARFKNKKKNLDSGDSLASASTLNKSPSPFSGPSPTLSKKNEGLSPEVTSFEVKSAVSPSNQLVSTPMLSGNSTFVDQSKRDSLQDAHCTLEYQREGAYPIHDKNSLALAAKNGELATLVKEMEDAKHKLTVEAVEAQKMAGLRQELDMTQKANSQLQHLNAQLSTENDQLKSETAAIKSSLEEQEGARRQLDEANNKLEGLENQRLEAVRRVNRLEGENVNLLVKITDSAAANHRLQEKLNRRESNVDVTNDVAKVINSEKEVLARRLDAAMSENERLKQLESTMKAKADAMHRLEDQLKVVTQDRAEISSKLNDLMAKATNQGDLNELERQLTVTQNQLKEAYSKIDVMNQETASKKVSVDKTMENYEMLITVHEKANKKLKDGCESLQVKIANLNNLLTAKDITLSERNEELAALENQLRELTKHSKELAINESKLQDELNDALDDITGLQEQMETVTNENLELKASSKSPQSQESEAQSELLKREAINMKEALDEANGEANILREQVFMLTNQNTDMAAELSNKNTEIEDLTEQMLEMETLQQDASTLREQLDTLTNNNTEMIAELSHKNTEISKLMDQNANLTMAIEQKDNEVQQLKASAAETADLMESNQTEDQVIALEREVASLQDKWSQSQETIDTLSGRIERYDIAEKEYKATIDNLEKGKTELETQLTIAANNLEIMKKDVADLTMQVSDLTLDSTNMHDTHQEIQGELVARKTQNEADSDMINQLKSAIIELQQQEVGLMATQEEEVKTLKANIEMLEMQCRSMDSQVDALHSMEQYDKEIKDLEEENSTLQNEVRSVRDALKEVRLERDQYAQDIQHLQSRLTELEQALMQAKEATTHMQSLSQVEEVQGTSPAGSQDITALISECEHLKNDRDGCLREVAELRAALKGLRQAHSEEVQSMQTEIDSLQIDLYRKEREREEQTHQVEKEIKESSELEPEGLEQLNTANEQLQEADEKLQEVNQMLQTADTELNVANEKVRVLEGEKGTLQAMVMESEQGKSGVIEAVMQLQMANEKIAGLEQKLQTVQGELQNASCRIFSLQMTIEDHHKEVRTEDGPTMQLQRQEYEEKIQSLTNQITDLKNAQLTNQSAISQGHVTIEPSLDPLEQRIDNLLDEMHIIHQSVTPIAPVRPIVNEEWREKTQHYAREVTFMVDCYMALYSQYCRMAASGGNDQPQANQITEWQQNIQEYNQPVSEHMQSPPPVKIKNQSPSAATPVSRPTKPKTIPATPHTVKLGSTTSKRAPVGSSRTSAQVTTTPTRRTSITAKTPKASTSMKSFSTPIKPSNKTAVRSPVTATRLGNSKEIQLGDVVRVKGKTGIKGMVLYKGETKFAPDIWIGLRLDTPDGKHNGTVDNITYFSCPDKY
eukprot:Ihof_evm8s112 gene=Ihof_evmTU8s112